jgi:hypothetical protein
MELQASGKDVPCRLLCVGRATDSLKYSVMATGLLAVSVICKDGDCEKWPCRPVGRMEHDGLRSTDVTAHVVGENWLA